MATASEDPNATPPWSRSGFTNTFKRKSRKNKGSETNSIASSSADVLQERRGSIDGRSQRRNSNDSSFQPGRKLSVVLGVGKRRSRKDAPESESGSEALSRTATEDREATPGPPSEDPESYTEDEEEVSRTHRRPTLSNHPSHAGYLTLSSPLITAETVDSPSALASESQQSLNSSASASRSDTLQAPARPASSRRSPSPVGRLKEAFRPSKRGSSATPEPASVKTQERPETRDSTSRGTSADPRESPAPARVFDDKAFVQEPLERTPSPKKAAKSRTLLQTNIPPVTPPGANGPSTFVTPPTPTDPHHSRNSSDTTIGEIRAPAIAHTSRSGPEQGSTRTNTTSHRRIKSAGQPSKLSQAISPPLSPAILEEVKTPGGTLTAPNLANGFFSSMFSAAQNAATQLTTLTGGQRSRSGTGPDPKVGEAGGEEVILPPGSEQKDRVAGQQRQLAIETLGTGSLSLRDLGIADSSDITPMNSNTDLINGMRRDEMAARAEDDAAAKAVSIAYSETMNGNGTKPPSRTPSVMESIETHTPTRPLADESSLKRAGSVRSRISGRRRRTRGSSAATGSIIAPVISGPGAVGQKLTGFAVANAKRNRDFHSLFKSVPEDDLLIEDYSAALQRDILLQGRMYISEGHICFSSNILGWVTNLVISFDEIISVEKKATALVFHNGIVIQTMQSKSSFASLLNRDTTYDLIVSIWKITHPNLKSTLNGAPVDGIGGDKTEKAGSVADEQSESEEVYDEDEEDDDDDDDDDEGEGSFVEAKEGSAAPSDDGDTTKIVSRKVSTALGGPPTTNGTAKAAAESPEMAATGATASEPFPGPATNPATDCGDSASHLEKLLMEDVIPAPLGKIYSLMFGPGSGKFMRKWLIDDQKSMDLQLDEDAKLDQDHKTMQFSYIKPLGGSIGPKQTKCIINQTLEQFDLTKAVTVSCATQNPDVPSGNIFVVKTRYCLSWAPNNGTKFVATCQIEWSGKSWLKGPIEKGANDGQLQYQKDIVAALKAAVSTKSPTKGGKGKKGGKRRRDATENATATDKGASSNAANKTAEPNWGLFEPLRSVLGPVADLVHPSVIVAFLIAVIAILWWRLRTVGASGGGRSLAGMPQAQRMAAYEELWRNEESELWNWIEERAGVEGAIPGFVKGGENEERRKALEKQRVKEMKGRVGSGEMGDREVREAIRVTRERLEALEMAVQGDGGAGGEKT